MPFPGDEIKHGVHFRAVLSLVNRDRNIEFQPSLYFLYEPAKVGMILWAKAVS
ncbi:hypothetical protein SDC9_161821 [bioreactor metagenome]|uniref:Uncharacterized protein n=1 Tax=bioreactor metagenome TaxID=1076179 RepID=A0A645FQI0_9ZZZZ